MQSFVNGLQVTVYEREIVSLEVTVGVKVKGWPWHGDLGEFHEPLSDQVETAANIVSKDRLNRSQKSKILYKDL